MGQPSAQRFWDEGAVLRTASPASLRSLGPVFAAGLKLSLRPRTPCRDDDNARQRRRMVPLTSATGRSLSRGLAASCSYIGRGVDSLQEWGRDIGDAAA